MAKDVEPNDDFELEEDCGACDGTGECQICKGAGESKGRECVECDGTGDCLECDGSGTIES